MTVALVPAAGRGVRLGAEVPKALVPVRGESLLRHAIRGLLDSGCVRHVVVAAPENELATFETEVAPFRSATQVVAGGVERTHSVRYALAAAQRSVPDVDVVLVHDAARAFTPASVIQAVAHEVQRGADAVIPVLPVADTIKEVRESGEVVSTVDRSRLRAVQTPQGFTLEALRAAYDHIGSDVASDDAGLVERMGKIVRTVPGHPYALKITTAFDLSIAESLLAAEAGRGEPT